MDNLLHKLEALKINGSLTDDDSWSPCIELIQKSFVPEKTVGANRPCEEADFHEYRQVVDWYLKNVKSTLHHILHIRKEEGVRIDYTSPMVKAFATNLVLLIGEHHEKNVWNTEESVSISKELAIGLLDFYGCQSIADILLETLQLDFVLQALRAKLLKDTWKHYPAAVACYKWIIFEVPKPKLHHHIDNVLPTALIIMDDFVPENVLIGLSCLQKIVEHSYMKKVLIDTGYAKVIFHALEMLINKREVKYVIPVYACISKLLDTMEHWDSDLDIIGWTRRDSVLAGLLYNMGCEDNVEFRRCYMLSLPQLLTDIGCLKWCKHLTGIFSTYCEHYADLTALKATLKAASKFLVLFEQRVSTHCVPLYTTFLKLYLDLTETPVLDREIMLNLEHCISLLYDLSPYIPRALMNNQQLSLVIKNNPRLVYSGNPEYFE